MPDLHIYANYEGIQRWIADRHRQELAFFPPSISPLAVHYLTKRLFILTEKPVKIDPRFGRPIPYLAFWFADAFGLDDIEVVKNLGLSLSYISLSVSIRDDLLDGRTNLNGIRPSEHACVCLANTYYDKYFQIFKDMSHLEPKFWYILADCLNKWSRHESWGFLFSDNERAFNPLSKEFLTESSSYLVAITLPTMAAIALLTGNEKKIALMTRFLKHYWMGWKIVDDIRDWQKDLSVPNFNRSSVLYYAIMAAGDRQRKLDIDSVTNMFLDEDFVRHIYGTLLKYYRTARQEALSFNSSCLIEFMDTQIDFHKDQMDYLLKSKFDFNRRLMDILSKSR